MASSSSSSSMKKRDTTAFVADVRELLKQRSAVSAQQDQIFKGYRKGSRRRISSGEEISDYAKDVYQIELAPKWTAEDIDNRALPGPERSFRRFQDKEKLWSLKKVKERLRVLRREVQFRTSTQVGGSSPLRRRAKVGGGRGDDDSINEEKTSTSEQTVSSGTAPRDSSSAVVSAVKAAVRLCPPSTSLTSATGSAAISTAAATLGGSTKAQQATGVGIRQPNLLQESVLWNLESRVLRLEQDLRTQRREDRKAEASASAGGEQTTTRFDPPARRSGAPGFTAGLPSSTRVPLQPRVATLDTQVGKLRHLFGAKQFVRTRGTADVFKTEAQGAGDGPGANKRRRSSSLSLVDGGEEREQMHEAVRSVQNEDEVDEPDLDGLDAVNPLVKLRLAQFRATVEADAQLIRLEEEEARGVPASSSSATGGGGGARAEGENRASPSDQEERGGADVAGGHTTTTSGEEGGVNSAREGAAGGNKNNRSTTSKEHRKPPLGATLFTHSHPTYNPPKIDHELLDLHEKVHPLLMLKRSLEGQEKNVDPGRGDPGNEGNGRPFSIFATRSASASTPGAKADPLDRLEATLDRSIRTLKLLDLEVSQKLAVAMDELEESLKTNTNLFLGNLAQLGADLGGTGTYRSLGLTSAAAPDDSEVLQAVETKVK